MLSTLALLAALHAAPAPAAADSIPGTWQITGDVVGNPINIRCTLKQTGTAIGGTCAFEGGNFEVTGENKDGKVTFKHGGDYQGTAITLTYTGTLAATPRAIKGTVNVQPFAVDGTFTATPVVPVTKP